MILVHCPNSFPPLAAYNLVIHNRARSSTIAFRSFQNLPRWTEAITVEDLLHHTSALPEYVEIYEKLKPREKGWYEKALNKPDHWYPTMPSRKKKEFTNKNVLEWLATRKRVRAPDMEYGYSNSGYVVLAELVERVAQQPFAEYVMETVIFGIDEDMKNTYVFDDVYGFAPYDPQTAKHARCYNRVRDRFVPVGYTPLNFIVGDGNVHSTIKDLQCGRNSSHAGLQPAGAGTFVVARMIKNRKQVDYGAGWRLLREKYEDQVKVER